MRIKLLEFITFVGTLCGVGMLMCTVFIGGLASYDGDDASIGYLLLTALGLLLIGAGAARCLPRSYWTQQNHN